MFSLSVKICQELESHWDSIFYTENYCNFLLSPKTINNKEYAMNKNLQQNLKQKAVPVIHEIRGNLLLAAFWLQKLAVGMQIVEDGLCSGAIKPSQTMLCDSSSGTLAYGLAFAARIYELPTVLVSDPAIDPFFANMLELLGAKIRIVHEKRPIGGYQVPRLEGVQEILNNNQGAFFTRQYDNPSNAKAYQRRIALRIGQANPQILVVCCGSGGSMTGLAKSLRKSNPDLIVVGVDTHNSVLFGHDDGTRMLRGLGNSLMPKALDHSVVDIVYWVTAAEAFYMTRKLFSEHGIDMGATTGAAFLVADHISQKYPDKQVLFIGPDRAERYISTVYNIDWNKEQNVYADTVSEPQEVYSPKESQELGMFSFYRWGRRSLRQVVGEKQCMTTDTVIYNR